MQKRTTHPYMKNRCQIYNRSLRRWVKFDTSTGSMMQVKRDPSPFARIRKKTMTGCERPSH